MDHARKDVGTGPNSRTEQNRTQKEEACSACTPDHPPPHSALTQHTAPTRSNHPHPQYRRPLHGFCHSVQPGRGCPRTPRQLGGRWDLGVNFYYLRPVEDDILRVL